MNITITQPLGLAIQRLKMGWRFQRIKRRGWNAYFLWAPSHQTEERINQDVVKQLIKLKLVNVTRVNYQIRYWRHAKADYVPSSNCETFVLPPEEFWVPDEHN